MKSPFPYIPPRTRAELAYPAGAGARHPQIVKLAVSLLGQELCPNAVFAELRGKYEADLPDAEIWSVIRWAESKNPQPCGTRRSIGVRRCMAAPASAKAPTPSEAASAAVSRLNGFHCEEVDLWEASPWRPSGDFRLDPLALFDGLYDRRERIAVTANVYRGPDTIHTCDEWLDVLLKDGPPKCPAGAWMRMNPVHDATGKNGTVTDADIAAYRFVLIESDALPLDVQLSLLARLPLPIAAIIASGGRSLHAWLKVDCSDEASYRMAAAGVLGLLAPLGFDQANKNPGRLSRLPGVMRKQWATDKPEPPGRDPRQRLIYLNPEPTQKPIFP